MPKANFDTEEIGFFIKFIMFMWLWDTLLDTLRSPPEEVSVQVFCLSDWSLVVNRRVCMVFWVLLGG